MMGLHESLDDAVHGGVTVSSCAPGARHPECGANPDNQRLIRPGNDVRTGPGRRWHTPASVVIVPRDSAMRWYCVEVAPRFERLAVAEIQALGVTALAPEYLGSVRVRQRVRGAVRFVDTPVLLPAFPRYVFAEFDATGRGWRKIATRKGVRRLLGLDPERPVAVSPMQMAWVIAQFGEDGVQRVPAQAAAPLPVGCRVRVLAGPIAGHEAEVVRSNGRTVAFRWAGRLVQMAQAAVAVVGAAVGPGGI